MGKKREGGTKISKVFGWLVGWFVWFLVCMFGCWFLIRFSGSLLSQEDDAGDLGSMIRQLLKNIVLIPGAA